MQSIAEFMDKQPDYRYFKVNDERADIFIYKFIEEIDSNGIGGGTISFDEEGNVIGTNRAIDGVDIDVPQGSFVAVLGHNGSGKSTLAKHMNAILIPTGGTVWVDGQDTKDPENLWDVRKSAGMVFQNPDNQIIGTVVEEDVGFGPENIGIPTDETHE